MSSLRTLVLAVLAAALPVVHARAQYTVHGSVVFTLAGESTPSWRNPTKPKVLTALGAQQLYAAGQYFRARYLPLTSSRVNGTMEAPILGLSGYSIDDDQTYVAASDNQNTVASAQAFMQGLYPPVSVLSRVPAGHDPSSLLSDNSYIEFPLAGYQYAHIHTASALSPASVFVAGEVNCPNRAYSAAQYLESEEFSAMMNSTRGTYTALGLAVTSNGDEAKEILEDRSWSYANAYQIYEYLAYQYEHNATIRKILESSAHAQEFAQVRWLASKSQYAMLGDISQDDGIRAIAGRTLANRVLTLLKWNMAAGGSNNKISLLFGGIAPFVSFFALSSLPQTFQSDFYGIPLYGSSMVFELFSVTKNDTNTAYPSTDDLWVRFLFRNGTTYSADGQLSDPGDLRAYPLFHRGPDQTQMPWKDFVTAMAGIAVKHPGEWCEACGGVAFFCPMYNSSYSLNINRRPEDNEKMRRNDDALSPQVAGVLGFAATFAFFVCLTIAAIFIGGVRFHRVPTRSSAASGGFKGGQKMASDADLSLTKNGAVVGVTFDENDKTVTKNERVGSWEMSSKDVDGRSRRESLDEDGVGSNPFQEPVKADERV